MTGALAEITAGLTNAQRHAVLHKNGPLLVVAGPGSGKTRVLTRRVAALVASGTSPSRILAVTFTNKAADEMRGRIADLVGPEQARRMWAGTFHAVCLRMLRPNATLVNLPSHFNIADEDYARRLIESIVMEHDPEAKPKQARAVGAFISWAKNMGLTPESLPSSVTATASDPDLVRYFTDYQERLEALGMADFDDLLVKTHQLFERHEHIRRQYQERFDYVLVDEAQDANAVQLRLADAWSGGTGNLCLVGDGDQSIYMWRGALPSGMTEFESRHRTTVVVVLEQNFRSTAPILEVCRALIAKNPSSHRPALFTENTANDPVVCYAAANERDEADWIVSQISGSTLDPSDFAVLVRTNAQTRAIEEMLMRRGIAYRVIGGLRFYDRAEVRDALAWLRLALNPDDALSLARALSAPRRGLGEKAIEQILELARELGCDPVSAARQGIATGAFAKVRTNRLQGFLEALDAVTTACAEGPAAALHAIIDDAGLKEAVAGRKAGEHQDRLENLEELVHAAESFRPQEVAETDLGLSGHELTVRFVEHAALISATDDVVGQGVTLITAHAAKGLEFPVVFVSGIEAGLFPHARSAGSAEQVSEERRLLYVACSRAAQLLRLSYCVDRGVYHWTSAAGGASPFLDDLPTNVVFEFSDELDPHDVLLSAPRPFRSSEKTAPRAGRVATHAWGSTSARTAGAFAARPGHSDPSRVPQATPPTPLHKLRAGDLRIGSRVRHRSYGEGTVTELTVEEATVNFQGAPRRLVLAFAPLELVP